MPRDLRRRADGRTNTCTLSHYELIRRAGRSPTRTSMIVRC
nr:MAG TPA_asm: hypothetical protein [Caudoviricetes sp.]